MALLQFKRRDEAPTGATPEMEALLDGFSIEVMPRTAEKIEDFRAILPEGTRVYIAHIDGTPIEDMVATARRLAADGFRVMPHFPARIIKDAVTLGDWITRYQGEAGVDQALLLAGGVSQPVGDFHSSMQLLDTGLFDKAGFKRLHVAGHPEGNRDIDPDGGMTVTDEALAWKQGFAEQTDAEMAIATQFCFEAKPVIAWADHLKANGITLPVHIGVAGPAKLQTLIKFAIACGVGPSLKVLQKRAMDVTKLVLPYTPDEVLRDLAAHKAANPDFAVERVHFFPLGGIKTSATWTVANAGGLRAPGRAGLRTRGMRGALLFDLDGTLLHSDPLHEEVFRRLFAERGKPFPDGFYEQQIHGRLNVDIFRDHLPEVPDPEALSREKEARFRDLLPERVPSMPGLDGLLGWARDRGLPMAVVTNAMRLNAEAMLAAIGARDYFDTLIIGEECARGKPAPDPYLAAMDALGAVPGDCIAFEDSPSGIAAARASGAFTIGVRSSLDAAALLAAGAHATIADFNDPTLQPHLQRITGAAA